MKTMTEAELKKKLGEYIAQGVQRHVFPGQSLLQCG